MTIQIDPNDPQIQQIKGIAMNSEHGGVWYSPQGPIFVSKEGDFRLLNWKLPQMKPNELDINSTE